jgi:hypothetical protein
MIFIGRIENFESRFEEKNVLSKQDYSEVFASYLSAMVALKLCHWKPALFQ